MTYHRPLLPNPFSPRSDSSKLATSVISVASNFCTMHWIILSPALISNGSFVEFHKITFHSPRYPESITPANRWMPFDPSPERSHSNPTYPSGMAQAMPVVNMCRSPAGAYTFRLCKYRCPRLWDFLLQEAWYLQTVFVRERGS